MWLWVIYQISTVLILYDCFVKPLGFFDTSYDAIRRLFASIRVRRWRRQMAKGSQREHKQLAELVMVCALADALTVYYKNKLRPKEGVYR